MSDYFYEPRNGHGLPHNPLKALIAPRPIGWISTVDVRGRVNLAPYSFFNAFAESPPIIGFATSHERKDSINNAEATGEFVANLVGRDLAEAMNVTSTSVPAGTPPEIVRILNTQINRVLAMPDVQETLRAAGFEPSPISAEAFGQLIREDYARWGKVVEASKKLKQ